MNNNCQNDNFQNELRAIRSERDFQAFVERNQNHPLVAKAFQMTKGKDPMLIAENLASSQKVDLQGIRSVFGF